MRKFLAVSSAQIILTFLFIVSLVILGNIRTVKADGALSVEGEWEVISVSSDTDRSLIGNKVIISRKGDGYEVNRVNANSLWACTGNERRIVHTELEDLINPADANEGKEQPPIVAQTFAGQKVPINLSYTLSADGSFLTREQDSKNFHWQTNTETGEVRNVRYEIIPGFYKMTLKRVSVPSNPAPPVTNTEISVPVAKASSAVAQVESRGEFYFLTKDGRKVTGEDASKVPLEEGTKVVTGNDGHIKMTLPDNTTFTVGPNSDLVIDKFVYDTDYNPKTIMASLSKGVFRWVTGKVTQKDPREMKVKLPVGTIGIRGTDFEATVEPDDSGSVVLNFGQLEITEKKTGFTFIMNAGEKITFGADGSVSRPLKI